MDTEAPPPQASPRVGLTSLSSGAAHLAAWGFAFLLLRVFAVSGYDWNTAFLVSTTLGLDDGLALAFGSLMANYLLTAVLLLCLLPLLVAAAIWGRRERRGVLSLLAVLGVVVLVSLTISYRLWWLPVASGGLLMTFAVIRLLPPGNALRRTLSMALTRIGLTVGIGALVAAAFVQTPWVPQEEIEIADGSVTGYVLRVEPGYLNILTEDHEFVILLSGDVVSRE